MSNETTLTKSLYDRLGGEQGIAAIVRDVLDAHCRNPLIKTRFQYVDLDQAYTHAVAFFCMGSGGPQPYHGRDMRTTHRGMNISEQEFLAVIDDIMGVLENHQIDRDTKNEVLGILYSMKNDIVRV